MEEDVVDEDPDRGTTKGAAEGLGYFAESSVLCRIVRYGEGGPGGVAGDEREVGCRMAAVGAGDDHARTSIDEPLEEGMALAHHVVPRVFVKERSEEGVAEDALGDVAY